MKIDVLQEDINVGTRSSAWFCPIACAVKRIFGHDRMVSVTHHIIKVYDADVTWVDVNKPYAELGYTQYMPAEPKIPQFINSFDISGADAVSPFSFELGEGFRRDD